MRRWFAATSVVLAVGAVGIVSTVTVSTSPQSTAQAVPAGSGLYATYCVFCHGADATGNGALADSLKVRPANLTELTKRNKGTFPTDMVYRTIDGRNPVKGHGGGDMPVWGDALLKSQDGGSPEVVKSRIEALVAYLEKLQR